jgi:hypothetical protein
MRRSASAGCDQLPLKIRKSSTTVHLAFHELQAMNLAFDLSIAPRQFDGGEYGGTVPLQSVTEPFKFGQS